MGVFMSMCTGLSDSQVIEQVAFDFGVLQREVKIVDSLTDPGSGTYRMTVCGEEVTYNLMGTVLTRDAHSPSPAQLRNSGKLPAAPKPEGRPTSHPVAKKVAFDKKCNPSEVLMVREKESMGSGTFELLVKGELVKYKKVGTVYMPDEVDPIQYMQQGRG